jgi:predicted GNAT family acetyltransferase
MFVAMGYREKGAIAAMEATSEPLFAKGLKVCIPHASDAGRPLYEALGFEPTNEMRLKLL